MDGISCARCGQAVSTDRTLFSPAGERICGACNELERAAAQEARGRESAARERPRSVEGALFQAAARGAVQAGATREGRRASAVMGVALLVMGGLGLFYVAGGFAWVKRISSAHGRCSSECVEQEEECRRKCDWRVKAACIDKCVEARQSCWEACPP